MENIAHLKSRSLLRISGADAQPFLQNLITCNVDNLKSGDATFGALLTPQGKILFDFLVLKEGNDWIFDVETSERDALMKRLTFYKLRADVTIAVDDRLVWGIWPKSSETGFTDPRCCDLGNRVYDPQLAGNASEVDWQLNRMGCGVPQSGSDFEPGSIFPHDALMDQFGNAGVDFQKGCYVGQEVVSRMHHRGTARNRFVIVTTPQDDLPAPGTEITAGSKVVGKMGGSLGRTGLALVRIDRVETAAAQGEPFTIADSIVTLSRPKFANYAWPL